MLRILASIPFLLLAACATTPAARPGADLDQPDPSIHIRISPPADYTPEPGLAARIGAYRVYSNEQHNRFVVSFVPDAGRPDLAAALDEHAAMANAELLEAVPGKRVEPLAPAKSDPFHAAGFPTRWFAYPTGEGGGSICDSAAVMSATRGGVWTISWNAPLGQLGDARTAVEAFMRGVTIEP